MIDKKEQLEDLQAELHKVQRQLKKVKRTQTKIELIDEENRLIKCLIDAENDVVLISHEVAQKTKFDMNELEII